MAYHRRTPPHVTCLVLYYRVKRNVFSRRLKAASVAYELRTGSGRLFQADGPATAKARGGRTCWVGDVVRALVDILPAMWLTYFCCFFLLHYRIWTSRTGGRGRLHPIKFSKTPDPIQSMSNFGLDCKLFSIKSILEFQFWWVGLSRPIFLDIRRTIAAQSVSGGSSEGHMSK